jgi:hypothetical protein
VNIASLTASEIRDYADTQFCDRYLRPPLTIACPLRSGRAVGDATPLGESPDHVGGRRSKCRTVYLTAKVFPLIVRPKSGAC